MATDLLFFNGVDGASGDYLLPPLPPEAVSKLAQGEPLDEQHLGELKWFHEQRGLATMAVVEGVDPCNLAEAGWGVIFAHDADPALRAALAELLDHRQSQAGDLYREYSGPDGYRPDESKQDFLTRHGAGPGPVQPNVVPYYLLLVGSPEQIPYTFQYQLDVQYAVGRLHFDTPDEYAQYARSVTEAES
ncbi:MAG: hypothetical protein KKI08_13025, partial [Armatimonadetes bacterium]|nr:hypothetical protein [Armatimonadota bacterium]